MSSTFLSVLPPARNNSPAPITARKGWVVVFSKSGCSNAPLPIGGLNQLQKPQFARSKINKPFLLIFADCSATSLLGGIFIVLRRRF